MNRGITLLVLLILSIIGMGFMMSRAFPGCTSCIVRGEKVLTPEGPVAIETLVVGDKVLTRTDSGELVEQTVTACYAASVPGHLELRFTDGGILRVTSEHPIAASDGFVSAGDLSPGDRVIGTLELRHVESVNVISSSVWVHNITTEPDHTYIVEGVLVHNKMTSIGD